MNYGELLFSLLVSLQSVFKRKLNFSNVTFPQILAISIIEDDGIDMSRISERLGIDNSTATRLIIGLEKKGWVVRDRSEHDNRVVCVRLTSKGEIFQKNLEKKIDEFDFVIDDEIDSIKRTKLNDQFSSLHWLISKIELKN
tara:strand:- start:224 stop:646 length:423 start_codon:yes stop_codon:yes gene_type:complete